MAGGVEPGYAGWEVGPPERIHHREKNAGSHEDRSGRDGKAPVPRRGHRRDGNARPCRRREERRGSAATVREHLSAPRDCRHFIPARSRQACRAALLPVRLEPGARRAEDFVRQDPA